MSKIPKYVSEIIQTLENAGFEAYIVGGSVRDMLLGKTPKDFDITTSATPIETKCLFPKTVDIGIKHGTVAVILSGGNVEVTTYRIDGEYINHRKPKSVEFTPDITEDLSRRDFTINAIAYHPEKGFLDPFGGIADMEKKIIKCVGSAAKRFGEDALRMVRAVRFAATLGFTVDTEIYTAIIENKEKLNAVSAERICDELTKLVLGGYPEAFCILEATEFFPYVLRDGKLDLKNLSILVNHLKASPADLYIRLALLFDSICKNYADVLEGLKFDNKAKKIVSIYMSHMRVPIICDKYEVKKILRNVPVALFDNLLAIKKTIGTGEPYDKVRKLKNEIIKKGEVYKIKHLAVNGDDLFKCGIKPGPEMGVWLEKLLDIVMKNPEMNVKERLLGMLGG